MAGLDDKGQGAPASAPFLILAWAGLAGAAGVALAAAAAHKVDSPALATAASMLTMHAAAALGLVGVALHLPGAKYLRCAALFMLAAVTLFSGEIAFHTFTGNASLQFLAPVGGTMTILSWLAVAALAVRDWFRAK